MRLVVIFPSISRDLLTIDVGLTKEGREYIAKIPQQLPKHCLTTEDLKAVDEISEERIEQQ